MPFSRVVISSGHGKYVPGAIGILDEHVEAVRVVNQVAAGLRVRGVDVTTFEDTTSHSQNENLNTIVNFHNSKQRDLDVSVHFNAYVETSNPMGTECLYVTQEDLARDMSAAISWCGFLDRGPKKRTDLFFLNNTEEPAILIETCFVDSSADADIYHRQFDVICKAIAYVLGGPATETAPPDRPPEVEVPPPSSALVELQGKVSWFGGPEDTGVAPDEGLAFIQRIDQKPELFLPYQPSGTTGLARRLNPHIHYIATRWDYAVTPHAMLLSEVAFVRLLGNPPGPGLTAFPADWGPNSNTGRVADISPGLMADLQIETDDQVEVVFPWKPLV